MKRVRRICAFMTAFLLIFSSVPYNLNAKADDIFVDAPESMDLIFSTNDTGFTKYNLTEEELIKIAAVCQREQGTAVGAAAEASLIANRFEMYGGSYGTIYNYVRNSAWFGHSGSYMDSATVYSDIVEAVRSVLVDGKRTLPFFIDEHDWIYDISYAETNGRSIPAHAKEQFVPNETVLQNVYGSTWTFYCFPAVSSDPFGYIWTDLATPENDYYYDYYSGELVHGIDVGAMAYANNTGRVIPDGDYCIMNKDGNYLNGEQNVWTIKQVGSGFYRIMNRNTGLFLGVNDDSAYRNIRVELQQGSDFSATEWNTSQEWEIVPYDAGYLLKSRCSGFCLNISGSRMYTDSINDLDGQVFGLIPDNPVEPLNGENTVCFGKQRLTLDGEKPVMKEETTSRIRAVYCGDGYYKLQDSVTGKVLTADKDVVNHNEMTMQDFDSARSEQLWNFRQVNGHFAIISKYDGYCLSSDLRLIPYCSQAEQWLVEQVVQETTTTAPETTTTTTQTTKKAKATTAKKQTTTTKAVSTTKTTTATTTTTTVATTTAEKQSGTEKAGFFSGIGDFFRRTFS